MEKKETIQEQDFEKSEKLNILLQDLIAWYPSVARELPWRADKNPYHVWLSEIMLQQTRVEAVKEYYKRFLTALPTIQDLAEVEEDRLLKLWQGLGYYNRAKNLKKAAEVIVNEYGGEFPKTYEAIKSLPGIGDYTAGAISSICYDLPEPGIDGNVLRIYARIMAYQESIDKQATKNSIRQEFAKAYQLLAEKDGKPSIATQSLMELGQLVCVPNGMPHCEDCPVQNICQAYQEKSQGQYPVKDAKKKRKIVEKTLFVLSCDGAYAIQKRPATGLLSNLWEFPSVDLVLSDQEAADQAGSWGVEPSVMKMKAPYTHIFSHVEWHMNGYYIECGKKSDQFTWATMEELEEIYALPNAFQPFVSLIKD